MRAGITRAAAAIAGALDARDAVLAAGLLLLAAGLWQVFVPAAFIVPGAVLTYLAVWRTPAPQTGSDD